MPDDLLLSSALHQAESVRSGEVSSRELVEAALGAIDRLDGELNAFVTLCADRALAEAGAAGRGDRRPLAGVPIAIKDLGALTEGVRTAMGSAALEDFVPDHDTAVVRRLREAGAIVVGKTSTPELGILPVTEPERFGPTRNPWDTARTPGGSSGGSGAAVAAGMVALAHANDGGGSIRIPASCCGLVGLKPSRGRVSPGPDHTSPLAGFATEGAISRTLADTAAALDVIAGPEPGDFNLAPEPSAPFSSALGRDPGCLRVAYTTSSPADAPVHEHCVAAVEEAAALLESLGHEVEEATPRWLEGFADAFVDFWIGGTEANVRGLQRLLGRQVDPARLEPLTREMVERSKSYSAARYLEALERVRQIARWVGPFWNERDVLLTPTLARPPLAVGALRPGDDEPAIGMLWKTQAFIPHTPAWNVTGQPAISLPLHHSPDGLPIGVQLVGPPAGEELLLSLGAQLEAERPWTGRRPPLAA